MKLFVVILSLVCVVNANYDITDIAKRTAQQIGALSKGDGVEVDGVIVKNSDGGSSAEGSKLYLLFEASFDFIPHECEAEVEISSNGVKILPEKCACHPIILTDPEGTFMMTEEEMEALFGDESDAFDSFGSDEDDAEDGNVEEHQDDDEDDDDVLNEDEPTEDVGEEETEEEPQFDMDDLDDDEEENASDQEENAADQEVDEDDEEFDVEVDETPDPAMDKQERRDDIQMGALKKDDNCLSAAKLALEMIPKSNGEADEMLHEMEAEMGMDYQQPKPVNYKLKSVIKCEVKGDSFEMKLETKDGSFCNVVLKAPNMNAKGASLPQNQCQKQN